MPISVPPYPYFRSPSSPSLLSCVFRCMFVHQLRLERAATGFQLLWRGYYVRTRYRVREKVRNCVGYLAWENMFLLESARPSFPENVTNILCTLTIFNASLNIISLAGSLVFLPWLTSLYLSSKLVHVPPFKMFFTSYRRGWVWHTLGTYLSINMPLCISRGDVKSVSGRVAKTFSVKTCWGGHRPSVFTGKVDFDDIWVRVRVSYPIV